MAYKVDLSAPAENRWTALVNQYEKEDLRCYAEMINKQIVGTAPVLMLNCIRRAILSYGWYGSMGTDPKWFADLKAEVSGLAAALRDRMDGETLEGFAEEDLFLLNIGYDFSTYCTSGIYRTENDLILFRNLDWEGKYFRKFTFEAEFERDGQPVFRSIQFLGQVGVLTALKPYHYAVTLNYRKTPGTGTFGWEAIYNLNQFVFKDGWSSSILLRYILEHEEDFASAKEKMETIELIAPCYLTLAGVQKDEAVIIERARETSHTRDFKDPFENPKFLVQTNHDIPRPEDQDESWAGDDILLNEALGMGTVRRREAAVEFLENIDEADLHAQLMKMLSTHHPVFNPLTIFSSLLNPRENTIDWVVHE